MLSLGHCVLYPLALLDKNLPVMIRLHCEITAFIA